MDTPSYTFEYVGQHASNILLKHDKFMIIRGLPTLIDSDNNAVRFEFSHIIYCRKGQMSFRHDGKSYQMKEKMLFSSLPNCVIDNFMVTPHNDIYLLCFPQEVLNMILPPGEEIWNSIQSLKDNPVYNLSDEQNTNFYYYIQLIYQNTLEKNSFFKEKIMGNLLSGLMLSILARASDLVPEKEESTQTLGSAKIFKDFIEMLSSDSGRHRTVEYYANKLCISPKYLSRIVKKTTGKTTLEIINEHSIRKIEFLLLHTSKSAKEISEEMDFSSLSFFGKFVKQHLGKSPKAVRER